MLEVDRFILPRKFLSILIGHAQKSAPNESVAIISGVIQDKTAIAKRVFTPNNVDRSTVSFTVDPHTLLKIYNAIEEANQQLIGIFHTHPAPPYPSGTDKRYMEVNPCVWLISSTVNPEKVKGFLLQKDGSLKEIELLVQN